MYYKIQGSVFEAPFKCFCKGRPDGEGNHNVIGVLLGAEDASQRQSQER